MKLTNTIRDAFIRAALDDVPKIDYFDQACSLVLADSIAQLPPKVQAIAKDKSLSHFIEAGGHHISGIGYVTAYRGRSMDYRPTAETAKKLDALRDAASKQDASRDALRSKLHAVAYSVSTRKALADLLPDFAKYLPADEAAALRTAPVVANVVADFVKAGWPKNKKAAA